LSKPAFEATVLIARYPPVVPLVRHDALPDHWRPVQQLPRFSLCCHLKKLLDKVEQTFDWGGSLTASQLRSRALGGVIVWNLVGSFILHTKLHNTG